MPTAGGRTILPAGRAKSYVRAGIQGGQGIHLLPASQESRGDGFLRDGKQASRRGGRGLRRADALR